MKHKKFNYEKWKVDATLAWFRFATVEDLKMAMRTPEVLYLINKMLKIKDARVIATEMLNNPNYSPMEKDGGKRVLRQSILKFVSKLTTKDLRKLLKMTEFKELARSCGIPVAEELK